MEVDDDYSYDDDIIDELLATVPATMFDSRTYYYMRYPGVNITYNRAKFQHTISLGFINTPTPVYVAGFDESMLLTWVGLECSIRRYVATSYTINLNVVDGTNPYKNTHNTVFTYVKVPPQVSRYEPSYVHRIVVYDRIDTGQDVHVRIHKGFNIELTVSFANWEESSLVDAKVVLKVQHPSRIGGAQDYPSWDRSSLDRTFNRKKIKSYKAFDKCLTRGQCIVLLKQLHCITIA